MQADDVKEVNSNGVLRILLNKYGLVGTAKVVWSDVIYDYRKGVDTFRPVSNTELFEGDRVDKQNRYVPSTFGLVETCIDHVARYVPIAETSFVDFGSGKGKVLIGAARRPFARIKGIEFTDRLHQIARINIQKLGLSDRVESILGDAILYQPAESDRVLYFFNPFVGDLLDACLRNIATASRDVARYLIYANPVEDERFCQYFDKLEETVVHPGSISVNYYRTKTPEKSD